MIPYGRQSINDDDINAVVEVLRSDYLTQGPAIERFEKALTDWAQCQFAVATNSATSALHLACMALEVQSGDLVWTSPISFVASANCALYCQASIDFVDVDPTTGLMSVDALRLKLQQAKHQGKLPKAIIPVHLAGHSCDMQAIADLCRPLNIAIIEDASHAIGASYHNAPVGNCSFSDICVFSFHPVKIVTTAEGGAALTSNPDLYEKLKLLRSHGITRDQQQMTEPSHGSWYYQQLALGLNYRMTDLQAALGESQLKRLKTFVQQRQQAVTNYAGLLAAFACDLPAESPWGQSSWHLYIIRLHAPEKRRQVFEVLRAAGIGVNVHYIPIHLQPYYQKLGFHAGQFPDAERFYQQIISLPLYADLSLAQQQQVALVLKQALEEN